MASIVIKVELDRALSTVELIESLCLLADEHEFIPAAEVRDALERWHTGASTKSRDGMGQLIKTLKNQREEIRRLKSG